MFFGFLQCCQLVGTVYCKCRSTICFAFSQFDSIRSQTHQSEQVSRTFLRFDREMSLFTTNNLIVNPPLSFPGPRQPPILTTFCPAPCDRKQRNISHAPPITAALLRQHCNDALATYYTYHYQQPILSPILFTCNSNPLTTNSHAVIAPYDTAPTATKPHNNNIISSDSAHGHTLRLS